MSDIEWKHSAIFAHMLVTEKWQTMTKCARCIKIEKTSLNFGNYIKKLSTRKFIKNSVKWSYTQSYTHYPQKKMSN